MPHPHMILERDGALVTITSALHHMLAHLRHARYHNVAHGLGLALPDDKTFIDLIGACAQKHQEPERPA